MKKLILKTALLACVAIAGNAQALPVADQGTWETTLLGRDINGNAVAGSDASAVFFYDKVLDVTWLRDTNAGAGSAYDDISEGNSGTTTDGRMTWASANTWAANLTVGSYSGWRLPTMISAPNTTFSFTGGTEFGANVRTTSGGTVYSEMASLWYDTLGNKSYCPPSNASCSGDGFPQPGWGLTNTGDFQNLQSWDYWFGLEYAPDTDYAWKFGTEYGAQGFGYKTANLQVLAVRPGDVLAPIPEPETYALMLAGLVVVGAAARRRQSINTGSKKAAP